MVGYDSVDLRISPATMAVVQRGMYKVVNEPGGTAGNVKLPGTVVCGKTGTAENPHGKDHSWFVAYAPMDNPTIVICSMVENAGFGSTVAAPIARDLINFYLNDVWPEGVPPLKTSGTQMRSADSVVAPPPPRETIRGPFVVAR
jgi:penicillin-binding protein 2